MDASHLTGATLGRYDIGGVVGRGGMGVVYWARDRMIGRAVALKTLVPYSTSRARVEWFRREAEWLSRCDDPHIVRVYDSGCVSGIEFIAMELMDTTLDLRIRTRPPADLSEIVEVAAGILMGLAAVHRAGIIHRDVKPANVGITRSGMVKLLDFGVADPLPWTRHFQESDTAPLDLGCIGSMHYMPPEQLRGNRVDERADVYSTGAVLYELATGHRPFAETGLVCLIDAILNRPPVPPSSVNRTVPPAVDQVILRALSKRPPARYPSVTCMLDALLKVSAWDGAAVSSGAASKSHDPRYLRSRIDSTRVVRAAGSGIHRHALVAREERRRVGDESPA